MFDPVWDLINGEDAHEIEYLNGRNQINLIRALFIFIAHHSERAENGSLLNFPTELALKELHRTATLLLLSEPGEYRTVGVNVNKHDPPPFEDVRGHVEAFFRELQSKWPVTNPTEVAAFVLWRLNWIHPFKNGNGRTARAFSYICLCLKYGFDIPGTRTLIDLIMDNRDEFCGILDSIDASEAAGAVNVAPLQSYIERLLREQLSTLPGLQEPPPA